MTTTLGSRHSPVAEANDPVPVVARILDRCHRFPDTPAIIHGADVYTGAGLAAAASRVARSLAESGVVRGDLVGLVAPRSASLVAAMLGIQAAGAAYVPLDPEWPAARLAALAEDAWLRLILHAHEVDVAEVGRALPRLRLPAPDRLFAPDDSPPFASRASEGDLAYVLFTSGSTGRPKGVMIEQRNLSALVRAVVELFALTPRDRVLQFATPSFDISVEEIFPVLAVGGAVVIREPDMLESHASFVAACTRRGVTVLDLPTAFLHGLVQALDRPLADELIRTVRLVVIGGERALPERLARWRDVVGDRVRLINTYGPTETTVSATWWEATGRLGPVGGPVPEVPIGRPLPGWVTSVRDERGEEVAAGASGELWIGGGGVARGYLGRPELTAERFVSTPRGGRFYRSGDRVRWREDGELLFEGRLDEQVKIGSYRVEPGEVENALSAHPRVRACAVLALRDETGSARLAAWAETDVAPAELRAYLAASLPAWMVPAQIHAIPRLPLTPGGKLDRVALRATTTARPGEATTEPAGAEDPVLARLRALVSAALGGTKVRPEDDLFRLGASSLALLEILVGIEGAFGRRLSLRELRACPDLATLARWLQDTAPARGTEEAGAVPAVRYPCEREMTANSALLLEGLVFHEIVGKPMRPFVATQVIGIEGPADLGRLRAAWRGLVRRHAGLRATFGPAAGAFTWPGMPLIIRALQSLPRLSTRLSRLRLRQVAAQSRRGEARPEEPPARHRFWLRRRWRFAPPEAADHVDFETVPVMHADETTADRHLRELTEKGFDLERGPLWHARFLREASGRGLFLVVLSHHIADGAACSIIHRELAAEYAREPADTAPPPPPGMVEYLDQEENAGSGTPAELAAYARLRETVRRIAPPLHFGRARPEHGRWTEQRTVIRFSLEQETPALRALVARERATPLAAFMAAAALAQRAIGGNDLCGIVFIVNRRNDVRLAHCIANFSEHAYLVADLTGKNDVASLLPDITAQLDATMEAQGSAALLGRLRAAWGLERLSHEPRLLVDFRPHLPVPKGRDGVEFLAMELPEPGSDLHLELIFEERADGLFAGHLVFNPVIYDEPSVRAFLRSLSSSLTRS